MGTRRRLVSNLIGLAGALCLTGAIAGLVLRPQQPSGTGAERAAVTEPAVAETVGAAERPATAAAASAETSSALRLAPVTSSHAYYPLEVGRYWVYRYEDNDRGAFASTRHIVNREYRNGRELFFFADGTIAYADQGMAYEMGSDGGVNVIPIEPEATDPYIYRSQGMQIEKRIGAIDTVIEVDGHQYERCLEVITRFRGLDRSEQSAVSYSTFYARGVGLVGRQRWPQVGQPRAFSVTLEDYGTRRL